METKIVQLQATNAKKLVAVDLTFAENGATIIGGSNGQGKTSVLDMIMGAIKGKKYIPSNPIREGTEKAETKVTLNNGVVIRRNYKEGKSSLKVEGADGSPQQFLTDVFGEHALDVRVFMNADNKKKGAILMALCGLDFTEIDEQFNTAFNHRADCNREEKRLKSLVDSLPTYDGVPEDEVNTVELLSNIQTASDELTKLRTCRDMTARELSQSSQDKQEAIAVVARLHRELKDAEARLAKATEMDAECEEQAAEAQELFAGCSHGDDIEGWKGDLAGAEETNTKVRANKEKDVQSQALLDSGAQALAADQAVKANRTSKQEMLENAKMPVNGLSICEGLITFNGLQWDGLSTAEQFMIGTAIQAALKPDAPIVLLDHMEAFDEPNLKKFCDWCERKGYQVIGTRVSSGDECHYVIEEGEVKS